jgi:sugar/nucleoside kinase (ribokinase family)
MEKEYRMVVDSNVDMSGMIDEGTLEEFKRHTGFYFVENDDDDRPFLVYNDKDRMRRDPDGRYAIGHLEPIREVE